MRSICAKCQVKRLARVTHPRCALNACAVKRCTTRHKPSDSQWKVNCLTKGTLTPVAKGILPTLKECGYLSRALRERSRERVAVEYYVQW